MLGMKNKLQIDIPLRGYRDALLRLKESSKDMRAGLVLSSLIGLAGTYRTAAVGPPMLVTKPRQLQTSTG
jgi:hypothetical protein